MSSLLVIFLPNLYLIISLLVTHWILVMQYRERVIFIGQHIDEEFSNQILATMLYLDSVDNSKKLYMYINGPGGDVSSFWTSLLQSNPASFSIFMLLATSFPLLKTYSLAAYSEYGYLWHHAELAESCRHPLCGLCLQSSSLSSCSWRKGNNFLH